MAEYAAAAGLIIQGAASYGQYREARKTRKEASGYALKQEMRAQDLFQEQMKDIEREGKMRREQEKDNLRSEAQKRKRKAMGSIGRKDTILTGPRGLESGNENVQQTQKSILGG